MNKLAFTVEEVADLLSVGRSKIFGLLRTSQLGSVKLGHRRVITQLDLDEFIGQMRADARASH